MKNLKVGDCLQIQCYKHNKKVHRSWDEAVVLDIHDDYIVFGDNKTLVIESDGSYWKTKEPAVLFFYKKNYQGDKSMKNLIKSITFIILTIIIASNLFKEKPKNKKITNFFFTFFNFISNKVPN